MPDRQDLNASAFSAIFTNAVEQAESQTVLLDARKRLPISGTLVSDDLVISVDHGIEKEEDILTILQQERRSAKVVGRDPGLDIAVLKLDRPVKIRDFKITMEAKVGEPVYAVGKPDEVGVQASFGVVTSMGQLLRTARGGILDHFYATSATPYPGFSGGPLVNLSGDILGVNTSGLIGGVSLVIPFALALEVKEALLKHGKVRRGYLGVRSQRSVLSEAVIAHLGDRQKAGLLVVGLDKDGPAEQGGMMVGDIIVRIGQQVVEDQDGLMMALYKSEVVGTATPFEIVRGGAMQTLSIQIGERS